MTAKEDRCHCMKISHIIKNSMEKIFHQILDIEMRIADLRVKSSSAT